MTAFLDAAATAARLPYGALAQQIASLLGGLVGLVGASWGALRLPPAYGERTVT